MSSSRRDLVALAIGCLILFGLRLGARDLWNPNEPIYGEAVVEMAARGDWLLPHVNGLVFAEKPILFYWLALAASTLLGGISEVSLRLPSMMAATATVLGSYVLVRPYAGRARALATAIASATLFGVFWNARFVQMDILVTATTLWVVIGITRWLDHDGSPLPHLALSGAAAGLGFIAKGPVGWVCPGLVLFFYLAVTRRLGRLLRWEIAIAGLMCLCVAAPWYLLLAYHGRADVVAEVLFRQNVSRFVNPWDHQAPWWYYLQTFWVDMAPWGFFLPLAFALPRPAEGDRRLATLSWTWIAAIVAFFSLARSKRSPYILPIAPAVAVLAAEVLLSFMAGKLDRARRSWLTAINAVLAGLFVSAGAVIFVAAPQRLAGGSAAVMAFGGVAVVAGALMAFDLLRSKRRSLVPLSIATGTVAVYLIAVGVTLPALNAVKSARPVCEQVRHLVQPGDLVASYAFWNWRAEYRYYLGSPIENFFGDDALRVAWTGRRRVVLFVEGERMDAARAVIGDAVPAISSRVGGSSIYVFTNR